MNDESGDLKEGVSQEAAESFREPEPVRWWKPKKEYRDRSEKSHDFWVGFGLWFGLNMLLYALNMLAFPILFRLLDTALPAGWSDWLLWLPGLVALLVNVILLIYFASTRRFIALGMLAAFGSLLLLGLCAALLIVGICFVSGGI